jgi:hypothetical protein
MPSLLPASSWPFVAVPSYRREHICRDRTLKLLASLRVPKERITLFVADEDEASRYSKTIPRTLCGDIVIAQPGMGAVRRYISNYYPASAEVLNVDDDITGFYRKLHDKRYQPLDAVDFHTMIKLGFWSCREIDARLWGIYPVLNPLFMKLRINVGLIYIVGAFWGCINSHDARLTVTLDDKEDFERTIKHFIVDGAVVRLEAYSLRTSYYTTPGGMQETRTTERVTSSAKWLAQRYPELCRLNTAKKSGRTEIRLLKQPVRQREVLA